MERYVYHEPDKNGECNKVIVSKDYILLSFYEHWYSKVKNMGILMVDDLPKEMRERLCVQDFISLNWASPLL